MGPSGTILYVMLAVLSLTACKPTDQSSKDGGGPRYRYPTVTPTPTISPSPTAVGSQSQLPEGSSSVWIDALQNPTLSQPSPWGDGPGSDGGEIGELTRLTYEARNGTLTARGRTFGVWQDLTVQSSNTTLKYTITEFSSSQSRVRDSLQKQKGATTFAKATNQQIQEAKRESESDEDGAFVYHNFLLYASTVTRTDGRVLRFTPPLPVFVQPAHFSRYRSLKDGEVLSIRGKIEGDGRMFATIRVAKQSPVSGLYVIVMEFIPDNEDSGKNYEKVPVPRRTRYHIDTINKRIMRMETLNHFRDNNRQESTHLDFRICSDGDLKIAC